MRTSFALAVIAATLATGAQAQEMSHESMSHGSASARLSSDQIAALAKLQAELDRARDTLQAQMAAPRNDKDEAQQNVRARFQQEVAGIYQRNGTTEADYRHETFLVSTDTGMRRSFDAALAKITGVPTVGQVAPANPQQPVPAGPAGTHIGHVVNSFPAAPNGMGLLPTAIAEAKTAATHAGLAGRQPTNLDYMKLHIGHVMNAIDPSAMPQGPGLGYGVKKAAMGVAQHIELAAAAQGASPNIKTHAVHVATSARNTVQRADSIMVLAKLVEASTDAGKAAALVSQISSLCNELIAGHDANGDGKITWEQGEGGLQQAQDHVNLMLAAERK